MKSLFTLLFIVMLGLGFVGSTFVPTNALANDKKSGNGKITDGKKEKQEKKK